MELMRRVAVVAAAGALAVAGCGSDDKRSDDTGTTAGDTSKAEPAGAPAAKVTFVSPQDGTDTSGKVTAEVTLENFTIDEKAVGQSPQAGRGHLHFAMDGGKYDNAKYSGPNGELAEKLGVDGKYSPSLTPTITYKGLPPGKHKLEVYLANNNHTDTGVEAETEFTVK
jgi:hypothetical protein